MARGSHLHLMACYQRPYIFILLCCAKLLVLQSTSAFLSLHDAKCKVSRLSQAVSEHEASSISDGFDTNDHIHLFSLKWTPDERISKPVRDVWRWKDASLGDGRDFFVPKPKTIRSLQDYIIENSQSIDECIVLSNCARLEIICVTNENYDNPSLEIARCLAAQVFSSLNNRPQLLQSMLVQHLDLPHIAIDTNADITSTCLEDVMAINKHWIHVRGCEAVCRHICLVAAGIAPRPRRPDREVLFRPFSSRDSHILLQLKRTREAATGASANILIEYAQRAGKAARSVEQVPEIEQLREYGSGDSKYSTDPPLQLSQLVAEAAIKRVINPLVNECAVTLHARQSANAILHFRSRAESFATNNEELKTIRKLLHEPTLMLREGLSTVDQSSLISQIEIEILSMRTSGAASQTTKCKSVTTS